MGDTKTDGDGDVYSLYFILARNGHRTTGKEERRGTGEIPSCLRNQPALHRVAREVGARGEVEFAEDVRAMKVYRLDTDE